MAQTGIENVIVWSNGSQTICNEFQLVVVNDNLISSATFYFSVGKAEEENYIKKTEGNLVCSGADYESWLANSFSTDWILNWACAELNLTKK